jgi:PKD repeat protein
LPPKALFTLNNNTGNAPFEFKFDGTTSFDPMRKAITYRWLLDDVVISNAVSGTVSVNQVGDHSLKLVVTNTNGKSDQLVAGLTVLPEIPIEENQKPIIMAEVSYTRTLQIYES